MSESKPAKPWRVDGPADHGNGETYGSLRSVADAVRELVKWGHDAEIWQWYDGDWRLYERIEAQS